jgi:hypothetical protein
MQPGAPWSARYPVERCGSGRSRESAAIGRVSTRVLAGRTTLAGYKRVHVLVDRRLANPLWLRPEPDVDRAVGGTRS